ncbi:MAG: helix-turn-helix domain-containing protein [Phycisphaerae bacterium]|nr:helix-turn-helix domain-containing protein [Phycisphaerae bacterium]
MATKKTKKTVVDNWCDSIDQAVELLESGKTLHFDKVKLPSPPKELPGKDVAVIRQKLNLSQTLFAALLNISVKTVRAWEQGISSPSGGMLKFLRVIEKKPDLLLDGLELK